jgi:LuxR family transcriptional regulator, maltose regulon positive regulatory protein
VSLSHPVTPLRVRRGQPEARDRTRPLPVVPEMWVERPQLMAQIDAAVHRALTLVVAPAGAGKTVTLARWAELRDDDRVRWLNARWRLGVRALGRELLRATGGLDDVHRSAYGTGDDLVAEISEKLEHRRALETVVIDDAHHLPHGCFVLLEALLNRCPDSLRVVLVTRWDPPVPLLLLEIQGHVSVIRGNRLRMTDPEARSLVSMYAGSQPRAHLDQVVAYAQGWAAVLVIAGQTLRRDPTAIPSAMAQVTQRGLGLGDLLASEVFATLDENQRHVLLCTSAEETVTPLAATRLSGEPRAGDLLAGLENIGLLVARDPPRGGEDGQVRFRLHPLLLEVLRRRFVTGGVEVMRAAAIVLKAARLERAHGNVASALRRMLWVRAFGEAADLVARHGPKLLATGNGDLVHRLATDAPDAIACRPQTWLTMALERRSGGDLASAVHWAERILSPGADDVEAAPVEFDRAMAHLLRGESGEDDMTTVVDRARLLFESRLVPIDLSRRAVLLRDLGAAETWLGRLDGATEHLSASVAMCRAAGYTQLLPDTLSLLSLAELMQGSTLPAIKASTEALALLQLTARSPAGAEERAAVALELARQQSLPWALQQPEAVAPEGPKQESDATTRLLRLVLSARVAGRRGADGRTVLAPGAELPVELPVHIAVLLDLERCAYAVTAGDVTDVRALSVRLAGRGALAEAACAEAALADMDFDLAHADQCLSRVIGGDLGPVSPHVGPHALVYAAQVADARGDRERADTLTLEAVRMTAPQRYAVPFLGWSAHGTPVLVLLARLLETQGSPWAHDLHDALRRSDRASMVAVAGSSPRARRHLAPVPVLAVVPPLTRREREVLFELAHGCSYADIAEALFVTENTVKTHVSSLYAKLGATRRSDALRAARTAGLV